MSEARRRFGRFERALHVEIEAEGDRYPGVSVNVGLGGLLAESPAAVEFGATVVVRFAVPQPSHEVEVEGVVRWARDGQIGVAFSALRPIDVWALLQYFNESYSPEA